MSNELARAPQVQGPIHAAVASIVECSDLTEPTVRMSKLARKLNLELHVDPAWDESSSSLQDDT